ncbi:putative ribonuclease H-like domain-containing protein [Tanacetum coccineum]
MWKTHLPKQWWQFMEPVLIGALWQMRKSLPVGCLQTLEEFQQPKFEAYRVKVNKSVCENSSNEIKKTLDALIIEDWVSDCDEDESEVRVVKSDNVKQKPKQAKQPRKMVQKPVMNNVKKGTGQREVRPVWNNAMRINHQNFSTSRRNFAPTAVLTKSGIVPISTARQSSTRAASRVSTAKHINNAALKLYVNVAKSKPNVFQKSHSLSRRPFNQQTTLKNRILNNKVNTTKVNSVNIAKGKRVTSAIGEQKDNVVKSSACWVWRPKRNVVNHISKNSGSYIYYQDYDGRFVAFAGSSKGGKITGKGKIRTGKLDFEDVYFVKELKFNLFSVSQMCDRKNSVLFTETECLILSPDFKLPDESQATNDESKLWHRRLGHINFKTMNKLVKGNLVRGLPSKIFENDHTCVTCQKEKQHKATLVTDDYSRFSWVFFLAKKDDTSGILKEFITGIENQLNHKVKIIRCDNRTEFKNYELNQFYGIKGFKREFSNAKNPQQNGVAKRKNRTLMEAARTIVLVTKPHNKTPYELLIGRTPIISFIRPFGCPVTILNILDHLGKFDGKADEGFLVGAGNRTNGYAGSETISDARQARKEKVPDQEYILLPLLHTSSYVPSSYKEVEPNDDAGKKATEQPTCDKEGKTDDLGGLDQQVKSGDNAENINSTNSINTASRTINTTDALEDTGIFDDAYDDRDEGVEADYNNLETVISVSHIPSIRTNKDHAKEQIISNLQDTGIFRNTYDDEDVGAEADINNLEKTISMEPKKVTQALDDESWVEAMQEELLWFKLLNVWTLVDLPHGKKAIGTKWVFRNKKDQRGIVVRNKARLVAQGYRQEEGVDYDEVFAHVARIEAIRLFLAYASYMDFTMYQMDVKSAFLYGTIEEENDIIFGSTKKSLSTEFDQLMHKRFQMSSMGELTFFLGLLVDILKKFGFSSVKTATTPMETHKPLSKDADGTDVDVHLYRSMIGSLMYLTSSRPDIMFAVCACLRFQVQPKASHMYAVKRIFRYHKGQPTLGLWYPKDSPMDLIAFSDSDYASASLDRKSTTGGCQFLDYNVADLLTKAFDMTRFQFLIASIVLVVHTKLNGHQFNRPKDKKELSIPWHTATVDGQTIVITEASVRRHLQLADADGISSLPNTEIFEQLTLMGYVSNDDKLTFQKGEHIPLFDSMLIHDQPDQGKGPTLTVESQYIPIASPTISQSTTSQLMSSQEQPSQVPTTEPIITTSSPPLYETTIPHTTSSMTHDSFLSRVTSLEKDLKQTKKVYGKALTKLVKKVKHLEDKLKSTTERRKAKMVISDDEEDLVSEDPSKQGRMTYDKNFTTVGNRISHQVEPISVLQNNRDNHQQEHDETSKTSDQEDITVM